MTVDANAPVPVMTSATPDAATARAALATLAKRGQLDLAEMLGLTEKPLPRTGLMKPARRAAQHHMAREPKGVRHA